MSDRVLRAMVPADVRAVVEVQKPASVRALAAVFPQERHPFPTAEVEERWLVELEDPAISSWVVEHDEQVAGYAAARGDELLHFGLAVELWGSGLADRAHDELLGLMRARGVHTAWLRVFTGNGRARAFYERAGWRATGEATRSSYPPCPELLRYVRDLSDLPG